MQPRRDIHAAALHWLHAGSRLERLHQPERGLAVDVLHSPHLDLFPDGRYLLGMFRLSLRTERIAYM